MRYGVVFAITSGRHPVFLIGTLIKSQWSVGSSSSIRWIRWSVAAANHRRCICLFFSSVKNRDRERERNANWCNTLIPGGVGGVFSLTIRCSPLVCCNEFAGLHAEQLQSNLPNMTSRLLHQKCKEIRCDCFDLLISPLISSACWTSALPFAWLMYPIASLPSTAWQTTTPYSALIWLANSSPSQTCMVNHYSWALTCSLQ